MSVNTAHASNGVLIHAGEYILLHSDNVTMNFSGQDNPVFEGSKTGRIYLTSHRMIFNNKKSSDPLQSFSAPFIAMSNVEIEQPVFGANYIKGKVRAQPNGNFVGEVKFKLHFKSGGAIEYGQALRRAAHTAQSNLHRGGQFNDDPPPYTPSGAWHEAPPPAYQPPPGYYGWLPTHEAFSGPPPNTVFVSDNPPPYPGIGGPPPYQPPPPQQQQPSCNPQPYGNSTPNWGGFTVPPQGQQQQQPPAYGYGNPGYAAPGYGGPNYGSAGYGAPQAAGFSAPPNSQPSAPQSYYNGGGFQANNAYAGGLQSPLSQQPTHQNPPGSASAGAAAGPIGALGFSLPPSTT